MVTLECFLMHELFLIVDKTMVSIVFILKILLCICITVCWGHSSLSSHARGTWTGHVYVPRPECIEFCQLHMPGNIKILNVD